MNDRTKIFIFVYLAGWIGVVAVVGFTFMSSDEPCSDHRSVASSNAADGGPADSGVDAATPAATGNGVDAGAPAAAARPLSVLDVGKPRRLTDRQLFVCVILLGIMGGALHGLSSAAMHIGKRRAYQEWLFFYLSRPPVGGATAAVLFLLLRGGVAGLHISADKEGEFTAMAWAAMAGLFSTVAMQKLRDIFDALFRPNAKGPGSPPPPEHPGTGSPAPPAPGQPPSETVASPPATKSPGPASPASAAPGQPASETVAVPSATGAAPPKT